jgi:hypothetical protein
MGGNVSRIIKFAVTLLILVSFSSCYPLQKLQEFKNDKLYPEGIDHGKLEKKLFWFWNMEQSSSESESTKTAAKEDIAVEKSSPAQSKATNTDSTEVIETNDSDTEPVAEGLTQEEPPSFAETREAKNLRSFSSESPIMFSLAIVLAAILLGLVITFLIFRVRNRSYGINRFIDEITDFLNSLFKK